MIPPIEAVLLLALTSGPDPIELALRYHGTVEQAAQEARREAVATSVSRYTRQEPNGAPEPSQAQWAALRDCESGGNYAINTGNGYYGAYQFDAATWRSVGGTGYPHQASPAEQDHRALLLWQSRGAQPWPVCGEHLTS